MLTTIPTPRQAFTDPTVFASTFLKVLDKQGRMVRFHHNAAQRQYLASRTRRDLILKARQLGMSTCIQGDFFRQVTTRMSVTATLAHEDETTQKLRRMQDRFYTSLPESFRPPRKYSNDRLTTYPGFGESVIATAGNKNAGRGGTYTHIHCSEVAFFKDADAIMAGILQGGDPHIVLESTPNGAQGWFYNACMEALDGSSAWHLHFFPWWIEPQYRTALAVGEPLYLTDEETALVDKHGLTAEQIKWRRSKQRELKHLFAQEYPENPYDCFLRSGLGYFGDLSGVFAAPFGAEPASDHRYVAGLDFGQTNDFTVLCVLDATTLRQVALLRINQQAWRDMRRQVINLLLRWNVSTMWAEANSMGSTNIEALWSEMAAAGCQTVVNEFYTTSDSKASIMSALHESLHQPDGLRLLDMPEQKSEFMAFTATQTSSGAWKLSAPDNQHDDTVIAAALAYYAVVFGSTGGIYIP